jgi:hypothetical protein
MPAPCPPRGDSMKLRIKGNSLRLRLGPSEVERLLDAGRIEATIRFAPEETATLTYALELKDSRDALSLRYSPREVAVLLSRELASEWSHSDQIAIAGKIDVGQGDLELLIEKDFACLDRDGREREDTFPNPKAGAVC